jgi:hypothetical protein
MVTKDISKYNEILRSWDLGPQFQPTIEVLTEIGNVFTISPDALRERLRGKLGGGMWEKADLRPYVLKREDVSTVGILNVLNTL